MKKLYVFVIAQLPLGLFAQSITPDVISSSGSTFTDGTTTLDWTLGEPATSTFTGTDMLTQGFHQPELMVTAIDATEVAAVNVYPNPTTSNLNILFTAEQNNCTIELFGIDGKLLESKTLKNAQQFSLDMNKYSAGNYMLRVIDKNNKRSNYKITKSN